MSKDRPDSTPAPAGSHQPERSARPEIAAFLDRVRSLKPAPNSGRGRLIFALDATMSRQPTWDSACALQVDMFREAAGALDIQLVYFRGLNECRASGWVSDGTRLSNLMSRIDCRGGQTQLRKVLGHSRAETGRQKVHALVFVGDAMEEKIDELCAAAGELGLLGVPAFMFQEGSDATAEQAYREIARLTRGAYCRFDAGAARQLGDLLRAVAAYASGGMTALSAQNSAGARQLLQQLT